MTGDIQATGKSCIASRSMEVANASGAKYIHATVNPDNSHSGQNFLKRGFAVKKTVTKYGVLTRNLLEYKVNS